MNQRISDAFDAVPRRRFLPSAQQRFADADAPVQLVAGQTCSQPRTVADMLTLLDPQPGQRVLDIGSGSGWTTALLAHLVGSSGQVEGVEIVTELAHWGAANIARMTLPWARIHPAIPGVLGLPDLGPFDRILVSAETTALPAGLGQQLSDGGRLVLPLGGVMTVVESRAGQLSIVQEVGTYQFVPLITDGMS